MFVSAADGVARSGRSDSTGPTAPTNLTSQSGAIGDASTVELAWTAASDASGVAAQRSQWASGNARLGCTTATYTLYGEVGGAATSASVTGGAHTHYSFFLTARDTLGHIGPASARSGPTLAR